MPTYYLEYGEVKKSLAAWGIELVKLTLTNQTTDGLVLRTKTQTLADPIFDYKESVTLWRDETRIFTGPVVQQPAQGSAGGEATDYVIASPWWYLEQSMFMAERITYGTVDVPSDTPVSTLTTRIVLAMGVNIITPLNNAQQIINAVQYAIDTYHIPIALGSISLDLQPPYQEARDLSVSEVIRKMLAFQPDAIASWDFTAAVPVLNITPRADLTAVAFDVTASDKIVKAVAKPRHDLVPSGVYFIFERPVTVSVIETIDGVDTTVDRQKLRVSLQSAGAGASELGAIVHTFTLQGAQYGSAGTLAAGEPEPVGLAAAYYAALSTLHYEGELVLKELNITGLVTLGQVINLTGSAVTGWSTMRALVQSVEYDFNTRQTRAAFGPPEHLGPQDFLSLIAQNQGTPPSDYPLTRDRGEPPGPPLPKPPQPPDPTDPLPPSYDPSPTVDLEVCNPDGVVRVVGHRIS